ncbi:MAG: N-acetylglucosamine kinase [Brevefilum sp.]
MNTKKRQKGFLLGVDTGTSKTHALIADLTGQVVGFGKSGSGNYEVTGEEGLKKALNLSVEQALEEAGIQKNEIVGMGFGLAGYDWPSERQIMIRAIESLGILCAYEFVNDVVIGLIAGSSEGWGIAVDAGTGNNVRGRDKNGRTCRITGNSVRFGEIGGAGEMVWQASIAVTYAWTRRGSKTELTKLFMDYTEAETESNLIEGLAMDDIHLPPFLAQNVIQVAAAGDPVALDVVHKTARELARNTNAVIRQLGFQEHAFEIILIGSLFKAGEIYLNPFIDTILKFAPQAKFIHLTVPPVVGAVLLAGETIGVPVKSIRDQLVNSTNDRYVLSRN